MLEKANAAKFIFEEHGIDFSAKELASKLSAIRNKQFRKDKLEHPESSILEVCQKIGRKPDTIALWLKLISVDSEIQTIELSPQIEERQGRK